VHLTSTAASVIPHLVALGSHALPSKIVAVSVGSPVPHPQWCCRAWHPSPLPPTRPLGSRITEVKKFLTAVVKLHTNIVKLLTIIVKLHTAIVVAYCSGEVAYPLL
jgi:hypothetical protein